MNTLKKDWFTESCEMWPGGTFSFQVKEVLHREKSQYQDIQVLDTLSFGRVLVLDGIIQCTQKDEFSYQEMISFLPLCCHKNPEKVLIVGGGDGGVAREVAKHPKVKQIVQVEIDEKVIEVSKKYLPFMAVGFNSEKLTLHVGDGFEFMKNHSQEFDVIITDSSDPVGPAVSLFQENYFALMKSALRPNGIVCSQAGTFWNDIELVTSTLKYCRNQFPAAAYAYTSVPTYPSGERKHRVKTCTPESFQRYVKFANPHLASMVDYGLNPSHYERKLELWGVVKSTIGFVIGSLDKDVKFDQPTISFTTDEEKTMNLRFYNTDLHKAAFVLPTFIKYQLA